jgi:hypothetical protein
MRNFGGKLFRRIARTRNCTYANVNAELTWSASIVLLRIDGESRHSGCKYFS